MSRRWAIAVATAGLFVAGACSASGGSTGSAKTTDGAVAGGPATTGSTTPAATRPARSVSTSVRTPTVAGPITGGAYNLPFSPLPKRLAQQYGYREDEYFVSGEATAYRPESPLGEDGRWTVTPTTSSPYQTRMLVRRPTDAARFNGVVVVEWFNVSSGMESDPDFGFAHDELLRTGAAWVGVSAQKVGIEGGATLVSVPGIDLKALKEWDPARYQSLVHPGDSYSYDIFSQAGNALLGREGVDPLGGLRPRLLLAAGESQSSFRMVSYVNAVQPITRLYDGFLIHSRGPTGAPIADDTPSMPKPTRIRDDGTSPVLQLQTETDLFGLGFYPARQPDTDRLRTWEVAGTAHADQSTLDYGIESGHEWSPDTKLDFNSLCGRINDGPQTWVVRAALAHLATWAGGGTPPPKGPPLEVVDGKLARDADGNALGGIRMPASNVPTETLTGEADQAKSVICSLFGASTPFAPDKLKALYPTKQSYVDQVRAAARQAVDAGFLLPADQPLVVQQAEASAIPPT